MTTPTSPGPDRPEEGGRESAPTQPLPADAPATQPETAATPGPAQATPTPTPAPHAGASAAPEAAAAEAGRRTVRERVVRRPWLALGVTAAIAAGVAGGAGFAVGHAVGDDGVVHEERGGPPGWYDGSRGGPPALPEPRGSRGDDEDQPDGTSSGT